jgi:hypothetical protein
MNIKATKSNGITGFKEFKPMEYCPSLILSMKKSE